jgi:FemAB family
MPSPAFGAASLTVWWPSDLGAVLPLLQRAAFLRLMQIDDGLAGLLTRYAFRQKSFHTSLIDLSESRDALWGALDKKSCRYEINKASRIEHDIVVNARCDAAYELMNDFIRRSHYRKPLLRREWSVTLQHADVFTAFHQNRAVVTHVILIDEPTRARLLFSATADRADARFHGIVGPLNKQLHWHEIDHYRQRGFGFYDFGGVVLDANSPLYSISQAKRGFGGRVVTEQIVHATRHSLLKQVAKCALVARHAIRRAAKVGV